VKLFVKRLKLDFFAGIAVVNRGLNFKLEKYLNCELSLMHRQAKLKSPSRPFSGATLPCMSRMQRPFLRMHRD